MEVAVCQPFGVTPMETCPLFTDEEFEEMLVIFQKLRIDEDSRQLHNNKSSNLTRTSSNFEVCLKSYKEVLLKSNNTNIELKVGSNNEVCIAIKGSTRKRSCKFSLITSCKKPKKEYTSGKFPHVQKRINKSVSKRRIVRKS